MSLETKKSISVVCFFIPYYFSFINLEVIVTLICSFLSHQNWGGPFLFEALNYKTLDKSFLADTFIFAHHKNIGLLTSKLAFILWKLVRVTKSMQLFIYDCNFCCRFLGQFLTFHSKHIEVKSLLK